MPCKAGTADSDALQACANTCPVTTTSVDSIRWASQSCDCLAPSLHEVGWATRMPWFRTQHILSELESLSVVPCRDMGGRPMKSPYQFGPSGAKTHRWLKIARGTSERTIAMSIVSNGAAEVRALPHCSVPCLDLTALPQPAAACNRIAHGTYTVHSMAILTDPHSVFIPLASGKLRLKVVGGRAQEREFRQWIEQCEKDQVALPTVADIDMITDQLKSAETCAPEFSTC